MSSNLTNVGLYDGPGGTWALTTEPVLSNMSGFNVSGGSSSVDVTMSQGPSETDITWTNVDPPASGSTTTVAPVTVANPGGSNAGRTTAPTPTRNGSAPPGARADGPVRRGGGDRRRGGLPGQRRRLVHHRRDVPGRRRHQRRLRDADLGSRPVTPTGWLDTRVRPELAQRSFGPVRTGPVRGHAADRALSMAGTSSWFGMF